VRRPRHFFGRASLRPARVRRQAIGAVDANYPITLDRILDCHDKRASGYRAGTILAAGAAETGACWTVARVSLLPIELAGQRRSRKRRGSSSIEHVRSWIVPSRRREPFLVARRLWSHPYSDGNLVIREVADILKGPPVDSASDCCCARSCGKANPTAFAGPECAFFQRPALAGFLPKLGPSLHPVATVILFGSALANRRPESPNSMHQHPDHDSDHARKAHNREGTKQRSKKFI
jgi:hypothetical protein